jgi:hypothetical protein
MSLCEVYKSVIQDLQEAPLSKRILMKKLKLIKDGQPYPLSCSLKSVYKDK